MDTERNGYLKINPAACKTCIYARGDNPFEDKPEKGHCMVYSRKRGMFKPDAVLFHGAECKFHEEIGK